MKARAILCAVVLWSVATATLAAVGRTPGQFQVSQTGAATYKVPLWMPPAPLGMQPSLAVEYSSANGNGVLGVGWVLSGLSSIERCNRTVAQDGVATAVELSANDRFCLNGNKLRLAGGTYGAASSTYRQEIDDYSTIAAVGAVGTGPERFTMKTRDGTTFEYGGSVDSRVILGSSVFRWKLNKATDASGNSYVVTYNNVDGHAFPTAVEWAATSPGASTYIHRATFNYSTGRTANDSVYGYVAGHFVSVTRRLEDIQIRSTVGGSAQTVRRYFFSYDTGLVTQRSRLTQIRECADDAATDCLAPTVIGYQAGQNGVSGLVAVGPSSSTSIRKGDYDFNGDQRHDLFYVTGGFWHVAFATTGGFSTPISTGIAATARPLVERFVTGADTILGAVGSTWTHYRWNGASFTATPTGVSVGYEPKASAADTNGDGFVDLVWVNPSNEVYIRLNTSSSASLDPTFSATATHASTIFPWIDQTSAGTVLSQSLNTSGVRRSDFDGDGRQDVYHTFPTIGSPANRVLFARNTVFDGGTATLFTPGDATAINMNDDACTDYLSRELIQIMPCANAVPAQVTVPSTPILVLDWDGDGRTDFAVNNGGNFGIYKSTGQGLSALEPTSIPYSTGYTYFSIDQDGDSLADIVRVATASPFGISFFTHTSSGSAPPFATNVPDVATTFSDGFGVTHSLGYVSTGRSNYTSATATVASLSNMVRAMVVVGQVTSTDGTGATFNRSYSYTAGRLDDDRRTFAGFEQRTETDARNNLIRRETYDQLFPLVGSATKVELLQSNGTTLIAETINTYQTVTGGGTYANWAYPYLRTSVARKREMGGTYNGVLVSTTTTTNTVDVASGAFSEIETVVAEESGANGLYGGQSHTTTRTITPFNDFTNHCLGKPGAIVEERSHTGPMGTLATQTTNFTWDGLRCRLDSQVIEPGSTKWQVTVNYDYDGFGNVSQETVTPAPGQGQAVRVTAFNWGTSGQFLHSVTNPLSQTTSFGWNLRTGYLETVTDQVNGSPAVVRTTTLTPDTFGRLSVLSRPDGTSTNYLRSACTLGNSYCGIGASDLRYSLTAESRTTSTATIRTEVQYFDGFDRLRARDTQILGGINSRVTRTYNSLGLLATQSTPHTPADPVWQTTYFYDALGRMLRARRWKHEGDSSDHDTDYSYEGLKTSVTNAREYSTHQVRTAWGDLVRVTDAAANNTDYQYHPFGYLRKTIDAENNETLLTYTNRGLKLSSVDPDLGTWSFDYYPLGDIKSQTDAKSQTTTFTHDALSRMLTRVEAEGTTSFVWDSAVNGIGQLTSAASPGGYAESYGYDVYGRHTQTNIVADGVTYTYDYGYEPATGLLETLTYPTSSPGYRLKLRYTYDTGLWKSIYDFTGDVVGPTLWQAHAMNARGQIIYESQENGHFTASGYDRITGWLDDRTTGPSGGTSIQNFSYVWDEAANLTQRVDTKNGTTETFLYDALDRLYQSSRNGSVVLSVGYDALGNIETKTGIGTYSYTGPNKHAVTATTSGGSYVYDANGNMTSRNGNAITWYSYNKPRVINGSGFSSEFWYGPTGERWKQRTVSGSSVGIRRYIGPYMERLDTSATNEFRHFIYAPTGPIAMYKRPSSGLSPVWTFMVTDHLGSTDVIMNGFGTQQVDMSFTPFGERKAADGVSTLSSAGVTAYRNVTTRGFTFHEHLDQLDLIHMNGRVYDPALGRFLSADPHVQAPFNAQSLNRYSYTFNNPLSYIDPTGYACGTITEIIDGTHYSIPQICPYPDEPIFPGYDIGGGAGYPSGPYGGGGGGPGDSGSTADSTVAAAAGTLILPRWTVAVPRLITLTAAELSAIVSAPILLIIPDSNPGGVGSALHSREAISVLMATAGGGGSSGFDNGGATTPGDPNQHDPDKAPLRRIHSAETIKSSNSSSYNYWRQRSTDEIVRSLRAGAEEPLLVKPDGRIYQGNTRILILEERGFDINTLPREILP